MNEGPEIFLGGLAISGMARVDYAENGTGTVATYTASGPESANAMWSLGGDDAGDFSIGSSSGVLTFVRAPDYENAADDDMDNTYMVTVMADDGTYMAMRDVTVMVTDVDEGTTTPVVTDDRARLLARYDTIDNDGEIDRGEMRIAVAEYFADPASTREGRYAHIGQYLLLYY